MTKYERIEDINRKIEALADAKGVFRCGLIWDISGQMNALRDELKQEDEMHRQKMEAMKAMQEAKQYADNHNQRG